MCERGEFHFGQGGRPFDGFDKLTAGELRAGGGIADFQRPAAPRADRAADGVIRMPEWLRITVGTKAQNERLLAELAAARR